MVSKSITFFLFITIGFVLGTPANPIFRKLDPVRYQYEQDDSGKNHLVDLWMTLNDVSEAARYNPVATNVYHLFTRQNPSVSQPLVHGNEAILRSSNFSNLRRTVILIHGWLGNALSNFNTVLVPALLQAEDLNVLVVDWSAGASTIIFPTALENSISSATAIAQFIDWLNQQTNSSPAQYHIIGFALGGQMAGIAGRRASGNIAIITGLDPSFAGWVNHPDRFQPDDGVYTEVIHTNAGLYGYLTPLAQYDFYPNGGESMPGCDSHRCDHDRSFHYFAESVVSGGFTGRRCTGFFGAIAELCVLPGSLQMGGLKAKNGIPGIYGLSTNAAPPFSQG
ncbi:lipase domain-containing protein [Phthorimaea operculella]|nr:lipase domain-containing protein [Phthorimaea operculella]